MEQMVLLIQGVVVVEELTLLELDWVVLVVLVLSSSVTAPALPMRGTMTWARV